MPKKKKSPLRKRDRVNVEKERAQLKTFSGTLTKGDGVTMRELKKSYAAWLKHYEMKPSKLSVDSIGKLFPKWNASRQRFKRCVIYRDGAQVRAIRGVRATYV